MLRPELAAVAAAQSGVFLRRQALACGYGPDETRDMLRCGSWRRVRHGAYAEARAYDPLSDAGRYRLLVHAVTLAVNEPAVVSHNSAAALWGLPLWGTNVSRVHLTRSHDHGARTQAGVKHHTAALPSSVLTAVGRLAVTSLERTSIDVGREYGLEAGVVCADAALRAGASPSDLHALMRAMSEWPGARAARAAITLADGLAESPGESLTRLLVLEAGLGRPRLQVDIVDGDNLARADMLVEGCNLIIEFDGQAKYQRSADPAVPRLVDGDVVWAEKLREDWLRELGFEVVRLIWADLSGSRRVLAVRRLQDAAARGRRRGSSCHRYLAA